MKNSVLLVFTIIFFFISCVNKERKKVEKIVAEWTGKTVVFPSDVEIFAGGKPVAFSDSLRRPYRVLLYVDSTGCTACKLQLPRWQELIVLRDSLMPDKLDFRFYFHPKNEKELLFLLKREFFEYPVFIDRQDQINNLNHFPTETNFQCFLLDTNNRVVLIGNPVLNPRIWDLYRRIILNEQAENHKLTQVEIETTEITFEHLELNKADTAVFIIKNNGNEPLIIKDIVTSCGCIKAQWEKHPVKPGEKAEIRIEVIPDHTGFFNKTLQVSGNFKDTPLQLIVKGTVHH